MESCSQDKQDLAAITGALAAIGALDQVRAVIETPRSHELLWAADIVAYWPRRLCLRCTAATRPSGGCRGSGWSACATNDGSVSLSSTCTAMVRRWDQIWTQPHNQTAAPGTA